MGDEQQPKRSPPHPAILELAKEIARMMAARDHEAEQRRRLLMADAAKREAFDLCRAFLYAHAMPVAKAATALLPAGAELTAAEGDLDIDGAICPCIEVYVTREDKSGYRVFESNRRGVMATLDGLLYTYTQGPAFPIKNEYIGHMDHGVEEILAKAIEDVVSRFAAQATAPRRRKR